ncbi:MAG: hypothetical protein WC693_05650 [Patescibacteria group bacterium]|jgi:hypothetical protein
MNLLWIKETRVFISKASWFVFVVALIDYLILFTFNSIANNFLTAFFDIKSILIVIIVSGLLYIISRD